MSFENRLIILPAGVVSKNTMGHLMILLSMASCILVEPLRNWMAIETPFTMPKNIIKPRLPKWISWKIHRSGLSVTYP